MLRVIYFGMKFTERFSTRIKVTPEYAAAVEANADRWVPACGGLEVPFTRNGAEWLYVYNPRRDEHGYLNLGTDIVQEDM